MEGQKIDPEGPVSSAYRGIEWTPFRAKLLADFYNRSPIDMQCNQSNGDRFPGTWDAMRVPTFDPLERATDPNEDCILELGSVSQEASQAISKTKSQEVNELMSTRDRLAEELLSRIKG